MVTVDMGGRTHSKLNRQTITVNDVELAPVKRNVVKTAALGQIAYVHYPLVEASTREIYIGWLRREEAWQKRKAQEQKNIEKKRRRKANREARLTRGMSSSPT